MLTRTLILLALCLPAITKATEERYYSVRADDRECTAPLCGGMYVQELNQATTLCPDNESRTECYIAAIDWSALQLNDDQTTIAQNLARSGRAIVRGQLAETQFDEVGMLGELQASKAWEAATGSPASGTFYRIELLTIIGFHTPGGVNQPTKTITAAKELNSNAQSVPVELDLIHVGASQDKLDAAFRQLPKILVAGRIKPTASSEPISQPTPKTREETLYASQFYLPFTAETADSSYTAQEPCYVGGCSGQVCSDSPDVITTCEYLPEYACYRTATCERQPDGNCGWTPTPELNSCLNHNGIGSLPDGFPFGGFSFDGLPFGGFTFPQGATNQQ